VIYEVRFTRPADQDLDRLSAFLGGYGEDLALRGVRLIREAIATLSEMPDRGRPAPRGSRELIVQFGSGAYIIRYRVGPGIVIVARIFHSLEDRPLA